MVNTLAVFSFFEKTINGKDGIRISSPYKGIIKDASIEFVTPDNARGSRQSSVVPGSGCFVQIEIVEVYTYIEIDEDGILTAVQQEYSVSFILEISCDGVGGGGSGGYWSNYGTGWPWPTGSGGGYDPSWYYWWTGGGGGGSGTGSASAFSIEEINTDSLSNPCMKAIISSLGTSGHQQFLLQLYQQYFGSTSDNFRIRYKEDSTLIGNSGNPVAANSHIDTLQSGNIEWTITMNPKYLQNASKEFIANTIFHELTHAFITFRYPNYNTQQSQHQFMFQRWVPSIGRAVRELYPGLADGDYMAMALQGFDDVYILPGTNQFDPRHDNYAIANYSINLATARTRALEFFNGTAGNPC